ncbi:YciI family protein [Humibacter sp.]|uniref:YciI family protein n=1 Tax=Humibacter sp. TaxID=1940291 RepID=UPI003F80BA57
MRYALLLHSLEAQDAGISEEDMEPFKVAFDEYGKALAKAGVLVAGEILRPVADTTQVTLRNGGLTVQDGPFVDTKEKLAGTFVIDVPDLDAALAWAEKCPGAQYGVIEVRPSAISLVDGQWVWPG